MANDQLAFLAENGSWKCAVRMPKSPCVSRQIKTSGSLKKKTTESNDQLAFLAENGGWKCTVRKPISPASTARKKLLVVLDKRSPNWNR